MEEDTNEELMTLREFYKNPAGKSTSEHLTIGGLHYMYRTRYEGVVERLKKKIPLTIFSENETSYYYYFLIPSDTRQMDYDVIIHFYEESENPDDTHMSMKDWKVEFFSNCPSFVFTYAYVYNEKGYFIKDLSNKLGKIVLSNKPKEKNPRMVLMWDKSIYYAMHHVMNNIRLNQRYMVKRNAVPFNKEELFSSIRTFEQIMNQLSSPEGQKMDSVELQRKIHKGSLTGINKVYRNAKDLAKNKTSKLKNIITPRKKNSKGKIVGKPKIDGHSR